jgi:hypothetical protein
MHIGACELHQNDSVCQKKERNDLVGYISNSRCMQKERNDVKKIMGSPELSKRTCGRRKKEKRSEDMA